jgi:hypothetical protein
MDPDAIIFDLDPAVFWPTLWATLIATVVGVFCGLVFERRYQRRRDAAQRRTDEQRQAAEYQSSIERHQLLTDYGTTITILYDVRDFGYEASRYLNSNDVDAELGSGMKYAARALGVAIEAKLIPERQAISYAFLYSWSTKLEDRMEQMLFNGVPSPLRQETIFLAEQVAQSAMALIEWLKEQGRQPDDPLT